MTIGPITLFDKSTLQALSVDEAVWFDTFYRANITPLFFVETLGNLAKEMPQGKTAETAVGHLAAKTPQRGGLPNVHHSTLCEGELRGVRVEMRRVPVIAGARRVTVAGRHTAVYDQPPEMEAFGRWAAGEFMEVERRFAAAWRSALTGLDLKATAQWLRSLGGGKVQVRTLEEAKAFADKFVYGDGRRYQTLRAALEILGIDPRLHSSIIYRWKNAGGPMLQDFAPYCAYVLTVELFFLLALGAGLVKTEPNTRTDVAYLYYLPFCQVFVSNDRLHERAVPLFLGPDQIFLKGAELKADLALLNQHFLALPPDIRERGVMIFATEPPKDAKFLTTRVWDRLLPGWRTRRSTDTLRTKEKDEAILAQVRAISEAAKAQRGEQGTFAHKELDGTVIQRRIPVMMGSWRLIPPEAEESGKLGT